MVELRKISEDNFQQCLALSVNVANPDFVDPVVYSLAEAWLEYDYFRPYVIYHDNVLVGFVSLYVRDQQWQIINFLIADAFQGKGLGSKAVQLCIELLRNEYQATMVSVPVHVEYMVAQQFWERHGFHKSDAIEDDYVFMRCRL